MNKMVAYCGIVCSQCPGFLATQKDDDAARKKVAEAWSKQFNMPVKPEDVNCDGCAADGERIVGYANICKIRKCAREKQLENCAYCDEYACERLTKWFGAVPQARTTLEEIRKNL